MEKDIRSILIRYWGFSQFRPMQEEIIHSVLEGRDTLALLPTGGGKSLCFQVPAMAMDGLCLVVSPLIALMKDQVEKLKHKGIPAAAVLSGMHPREIERTLNNCIHGPVKFLYLSPERLESENVRRHLPHMNVSLLAVDEAHCISQWGYDFRPSYRRLAAVRDLFPTAPMLALTATATPEVQQDIQRQLRFRAEHILQKSFERINLAYVVLQEEDKTAKAVRIAHKLKGQGIVYVRSRRKARDLSEQLNRQGVPAGFYHAGMDLPSREQAQEAWMKNRFRVMVATNAFGMGIDKGDVRFVIHADLPDCLEAYFQEAGRAGRDEKKAYAVLLYNHNDRLELERHADLRFPPLAEVRRVYQALANYLQLPVGAGRGTSYPFDLAAFCHQYALEITITHAALQVLELQGYLRLDDFGDTQSRIRITAPPHDVYEFQVRHPGYDHLVKVLLRSYEGLFENYVPVREQELARRAELSPAETVRQLEVLQQQQLLDYLPARRHPELTFLTERLDQKNLAIDPQHLAERKARHMYRMDAILRYAEDATVCRSIRLLRYFGEEAVHRCGHCDVCLKRNRTGLSDPEFEEVQQEVQALLLKEPLPLDRLVEAVRRHREDTTLKVVDWLLDHRQIAYEGAVLKWTG
jgi:ATP-dependent DNA helicase RecQ